MYIVARGAGNAFCRMLGFGPVNELLMVPFGELVGIDVFHVASFEGGRSIIRFKSFAGGIAHRPAAPFDFSGFAPVVARTADLDGNAHSKFGRIDNGLTLFENRCLR